MKNLCPKCKGVLQAMKTKDEYFERIDDDKWHKVGEEITTHFCCENNCELNEKDVPKLDC